MKNYLEEIGFVLVLLFLALLLVFSLFWALSIGTVKLPVREIYETVLAQFTSGEPITAPGQGPVHDIVWLLRLPRVILAFLVGCGLAVCGVITPDGTRELPLMSKDDVADAILDEILKRRK